MVGKSYNNEFIPYDEPLLAKKAGAVVFVVLLLIYLYTFNTVVKLPGSTGVAAMVVGILVIIGVSIAVARKR